MSQVLGESQLALTRNPSPDEELKAREQTAHNRVRHAGTGSAGLIEQIGGDDLLERERTARERIRDTRPSGADPIEVRVAHLEDGVTEVEAKLLRLASPEAVS